MNELLKTFEDIENEAEKLLVEFEVLNKQTNKLKSEYINNPKDKVLLQEIHNHEQKYKNLCIRIKHLKIKAKQLKQTKI